MASCPNCGRKTLRTLDWACQWCGYPLLSRAYKKIDKTFKQLQEERNAAARTESAAEETEYIPETAPEPTYEPAPPAAPAPETALAPPLEPELPSVPAPAPVSSLPEEPAPVSKRKSKAASGKGTKPAKKPAPGPENEPVLEQEPMITPPPAAPPPPAPPPEPPPVAAPKLETLTDGESITVDELDALFRENKVAAHAGLANKTMNIKGVVEKVFIRDHIDVRYIVLRGSQKKLLWPVRCTFDKEVVSEMYRLKEGQEVTIRGKYDGYGKNIIFKECAPVS
jgi:ribosomal protein L37E